MAARRRRVSTGLSPRDVDMGCMSILGCLGIFIVFVGLLLFFRSAFLVFAQTGLLACRLMRVGDAIFLPFTAAVVPWAVDTPVGGVVSWLLAGLCLGLFVARLQSNRRGRSRNVVIEIVGLVLVMMAVYGLGLSRVREWARADEQRTAAERVRTAQQRVDEQARAVLVRIPAMMDSDSRPCRSPVPGRRRSRFPGDGGHQYRCAVTATRRSSE